MKKYLVGILISVLPIILMSHNAYALDYTTVSESNGSGAYGYDVVSTGNNHNIGRNASWNGNFPVILLSGDGSNVIVKNLYGVQKNYSFGSLPSDKNSYSVKVKFIVSSSGSGYVENFSINDISAVFTLANNTTKNATCGYPVRTTGNHLYQMEVECGVATNSRPVSASMTAGKTAGFVVGSDTPIAYISGFSTGVIAGSNVSIAYSSWSWAASDDSSALILDGLNTVDNSINDFHNDFNNYINDINSSTDYITNQSPSDISGSTDSNTESLMTVFGNFVAAISSASATNCNIVANWGHLNLGTLNLCRDNPPSFVQIIGSIVLIAILVPCAYWLVMRILSEIRSFTNG